MKNIIFWCVWCFVLTINALTLENKLIGLFCYLVQTICFIYWFNKLLNHINKQIKFK